MFMNIYEPCILVLDEEPSKMEVLKNNNTNKLFPLQLRGKVGENSRFRK